MTTVCASTHLARALVREDTRRRVAAGEQVWQTPDILSWNAWLKRQWDAVTMDPPPDLPLLLDSSQERLVWERIINESGHGDAMLDRGAAARLAAAAHALVRAYRIPDRGALYRVSDDAAAFEAWQIAFLRTCEREGWIPSAALADQLAGEGSISLAGFDDLTPQQTDFLSHFNVERRPMPTLDAHAEARLFPDAATERRACARWASDLHQREPHAALAVFAFDLTTQRAAWDEAFARGFPSRYAIGAGVPLATLPLAASALSLLELLDNEISVAAAGAILLSPYVDGYTDERFVRASMDQQLRKGGGPAIPLWRMAKHEVCPRLHAALNRWIKHREDLPREQPPSDWARAFHQLFTTFGWPGDQRLNAEEFPVYEAWRDALSGFAALDRVQGAIPAWRARQLLEMRMGETLFDSAPTSAAVHILPAPEAMGATYDAVWVAGAHDGVWPSPPALNPFLPAAVQRQFKLARATPEDILRRAKQWTAQLHGCARELIVSAAETEKKEPRRLSSLFAGLPQTHPDPNTEVRNAIAFEEFVDETAPPPAKTAQQGGVSLFKHQAQCPFHAFAELRLYARELEEPSLGFDNRQQGTALHVALDELWKELRDWHTLTSLSHEEVQAAIARAVDRTLTEKWRAETQLRNHMRQVERERLIELLSRWLREERKRKPFAVIAQEQKAIAAIGGLTVEVRTDRVDRLDDGRLVVIDYKTGKAPSVTAWDGARIAEPQLPLYAVTSEQPVAAVAFAQVNAEKRLFRGAAEEKNLLPLSKHLALDGSMRARWRTSLETSAQEFLTGEARVDPLRGACDFCKLDSLCRKYELQQASAEDDDGE